MRRVWGSLTGKGPQQAPVIHKASRALELNAAISRLWQADGTHARDAFEHQVVPIYTALLDQLKQQQPAAEAETNLLELLDATTAACRYRWSVRLPMKRPGSDYRKYEIIYTYALVTAMAVQCLREATADASTPEALAAIILPEAGRAQLQADATVWEDWLGFFDQAALGGLYMVSRCGQSGTPEQPTTTRGEPKPKKVDPIPPPGSGKAMLAAIKDALQAGTLSYNQPGDPVQVDREGRTYLVHPIILDWCKEALALDDDTKRLENRFSRLKIFKRTPGGNLLYRGRLSQQDQPRQGYLVEDPAQLWLETAPRGRFVIENVTAKR